MRPVTRTEPVLSAAAFQVTAAVAAGLGLRLSPPVTAGVLAGAAILAAVLTAAAVDKTIPVAVTGFFTAAGTLLAALGIPHIPAGTAATVSAVLAGVLGLILRGHVTPVKGTHAARNQDTEDETTIM